MLWFFVRYGVRLRLSYRRGSKERARCSRGLRQSGLGPLILGRRIRGGALIGSAVRFMIELVDLLRDATNMASQTTLRETVGIRLQLLASDVVTIVISWSI